MTKCLREKCRRKSRSNVPWCNFHYEAERRRREALGGRKCGYIPAAPVLDHINSLKALGVGNRRIAELAGVTLQTVLRYKHHPYAYVDTAHKILSIPLTPALAADAAKVSIVGSMRRLQGLIVLGYTSRQLSERLGVSDTQLYIWANGKQPGIFGEKAREIDRLYRELEMIPAPNTHAGRRAKLRAQRNGWLPPMAWDDGDIDNPDAEPQLPEGHRDAWHDDYLEYRGRGLTHAEIADRMGIERKSLTTKLRRLHATAHRDQEHESVWQGDEQMARAG